MISEAVENTDKEIWASENGDRIFLTSDEAALGICAGGFCVTLPLKKWVKLGWHGSIEDRFERLEDAVSRLSLHPSPSPKFEAPFEHQKS